VSGSYNSAQAQRQAVHDAVCLANGKLFAGAQTVRDTWTTDVARLQEVWPLTPRLSLTGRYEHLAAGPAWAKARYGSSAFFAG